MTLIKTGFEVGNLENGAGSPGGDPFGSISGRRFTVNKAGEYLVTFQLYDISKNHPTDLNSPIHTPSDPLDNQVCDQGGYCRHAFRTDEWRCYHDVQTRWSHEFCLWKRPPISVGIGFRVAEPIHQCAGHHQ